MNGSVPALSARRAAWLLAGAAAPPVPAASAPLSAGEAERMELVEALASHMKSCDADDVAVCRRLLEHLCGPIGIEPATSRLQ